MHVGPTKQWENAPTPSGLSRCESGVYAGPPAPSLPTKIWIGKHRSDHPPRLLDPPSPASATPNPTPTRGDPKYAAMTT